MKSYKLFETVDIKSIQKICEEYHIKNYTINEDGTVDVDGVVNLYKKNLTKLPLKFGRVTGYFNCSNNNLTSLQGCPKWVGSNFYCSHNQLTNLEGCPEYVGEYLFIGKNFIIDLKYIPDNIKEFLCYGNPVSQIWKLFEDVSKIELFNDYDPVRIIDNKPTIILDRLNDFLQDIGKPTVTQVKGYKII